MRIAPYVHYTIMTGFVIDGHVYEQNKLMTSSRFKCSDCTIINRLPVGMKPELACTFALNCSLILADLFATSVEVCHSKIRRQGTNGKEDWTFTCFQLEP